MTLPDRAGSGPYVPLREYEMAAQGRTGEGTTVTQRPAPCVALSPISAPGAPLAIGGG